MSLSPGVSWPPVQGIDSSGRAPPGPSGRGGGWRAGTGQELRTKSGFELDLKSCSDQGPSSGLGPRQNPGSGSDLNSGRSLEQLPSSQSSL